MIFTLSLTAGMVVAFNPCGVAILPSYLAYLLSGRVESRRAAWFDGARSGLLMTAGFVVLFALAGLLVGTLGALVFMVVPYISIAMALFLLVLAHFVWHGRLSSGLRTEALAARVETVFKSGSAGSFFAYGVGYGLASLSCSLPVFLAIATQGLTRGPVGGAVTFLLFAVGMGVVVTLLSVAATTARTLAEQIISSVLPVVQKLSALVMVGAALYLLWYWLVGPQALLAGL